MAVSWFLSVADHEGFLQIVSGNRPALSTMKTPLGCRMPLGSFQYVMLLHLVGCSYALCVDEHHLLPFNVLL